MAARIPVRSSIVIVGGRLLVDRRPSGVTVVMHAGLIEGLRAFPAALTTVEISPVYDLARRSTTWNPYRRS